MALKWVSALMAAASAGMFTAANVGYGTVPVAVNLSLVATCAAGVVLVAVTELYQRLDSRLSAISDFLVARLDEVVSRLDDLDAGPGERGLDALLSETDNAVVPIAPRRTGR